jgi:hypothetical protein
MKCIYDPASGNIYRMKDFLAHYLVKKYGADGVRYSSKQAWREGGRKTEKQRMNGDHNGTN